MKKAQVIFYSFNFYLVKKMKEIYFILVARTEISHANQRLVSDIN